MPNSQRKELRKTLKEHLRVTRNVPDGPLKFGIDEVGTGAWAGPVVAACVLLDPSMPVKGLRDSKKLTHEKRVALFGEIIRNAHYVSVTGAPIEFVNAYGPHESNYEVQRYLIELARGLNDHQKTFRIDGNRDPGSGGVIIETIVQGDTFVPDIMAASIVAKVVRDRFMKVWHESYPEYMFLTNSGYGTPEHRNALQQHGICPVHRTTLKPIQDIMKVTGECE